MPLLVPEPIQFPADLFSQPESPFLGEARWWVVHTRPRAEKALARRLFKKNLSFFLPVYERHWRKNGRAFSAHLPLFSSYLFLHGDSMDRLACLETNMVVHYLDAGFPFGSRPARA